MSKIGIYEWRMLTGHREGKFKVDPVAWVANHVEDKNSLREDADKLQETTANGHNDRVFSLVSEAVKRALDHRCVRHLDDGPAMTNSVLFIERAGTVSRLCD